MNSAGWVRAQNWQRCRYQGSHCFFVCVDEVSGSVPYMLRCRLPHSRNRTWWRNWPNTLQKTSGKRKPTVIFVAVLRAKVHRSIWLLALYVGVKLVLPLPGLESRAGPAGCCNCRGRWQLGQCGETLWGFQLCSSTSLFRMHKLQFERHNLDNSVRVDFHTWGQGHILMYRSFSLKNFKSPLQNMSTFGFFFFLRKQTPEMYFSSLIHSGWN